MSLEYLALGMMMFVGIVFFYGIIAIHDIPYEIAKKRGHPHLEAIHYAGWISMFTLHSIWPFLWIWATIYHADRGYGFSESSGQMQRVIEALETMDRRMGALENRVAESAPEIIVPDNTPVQPEPEEA
ncbi:MAG: DUF3302 domain-containing protein [Alphaproteobacteria bacterium]|nr:DUF3302 domain-containing protein [Alphaproteobacteria bacterium]